MKPPTYRWALAVVLCGLAGCATKPYDYGAFWQHPPRSILVLPPINETATVDATYTYLSTISQPLGDRGYYVFPVEVVDQLLKSNGMPTAGEMHDVPLDKVAEVIGADAVLYVAIDKYTSRYVVLAYNAEVHVRARLIDTRSGTLLWEGVGVATDGTGYSSDVVGMAVSAVVSAIVSTSTDERHALARAANFRMIFDDKTGLPAGPYAVRPPLKGTNWEAPKP